MPDHNFSNLYALIIGINKYKSPVHHDLDGCVSDATSVNNYLMEILRVPEDHIKCLFDEQATRKGILDAFWKHLILNENIQPSDPILIYYSGHGDRQEAPTGWHSSDGHLELILPHDASAWDEAPDSKPSSGESGSGTDGTNHGPGRYDPNKNYKHGIPDRTLGALIHRLSEAKGDNITIILDSCHSGSATRGFSRMRHSHDPDAPPIPLTIDEDVVQLPSQAPASLAQSMTITKQEFGKFVAPSQAPSLETHVLLAACRSDQGAQEMPDYDPVTGETSSYGLFTKALLAALKGCDMATTSYPVLMRDVQKHMIDIVASLPQTIRCKTQLPQCEGQKQDRHLFRTQFSLTKGMIQLDRGRWHNTFQIKAGSASGIQEGTELGVYAGNMQRTSPPIARLVAVQVNATTSTLRIQDADSNVEIPENAYVLVTKYTGHSVRILVDDQLKILPLWQEVFSELQSQPIDIVWSKPGEPSGIVLVSSDAGAIVQPQDPSVVQLRPREIILRPQLGSRDLARKLSAMAHFHFHLQRRNPESPLRGLVGMKLVELKAKPGRVWGVKEYIPISENPDDLFGNSLSDETIVELRATPDKRYGLQLTNNSNWPLFTWVLYFDLEDYSISFLYKPPARNTNPPLSTNGKVLAVGYGDAAMEPLRVDKNGYSNRESGIFMLFASSAWVDIPHMEQQSIFDPPSKDGARNQGQPVSPDSIVWDVLVVGVSISQ